MKKTISALAILVLTLLFVQCNETGDTSPLAPPAAKENNVKIQESVNSTNQSRRKALNQIINEDKYYLANSDSTRPHR